MTILAASHENNWQDLQAAKSRVLIELLAFETKKLPKYARIFGDGNSVLINAMKQKHEWNIHE